MASATQKDYPILFGIKKPTQIQGYSIQQLNELAEECRQFLISSISNTGGHLGAALGVIELTLALFKIYDFSQDLIVWDVGHQAHVHKLLTGRANRFNDYGKWGGMSKFLEREESSFDHFGAGHASTSISAALGMGVARNLLKKEQKIIAVIGDGGLTGGLAYEALNAAGALGLKMLVIFNDNGMSIDENVGAISRFITNITISSSYNTMRSDIKKIHHRLPFGGSLVRNLRHMERSFKDYGSPNVGALIEAFNFRYFGPVEGHSLKDLVKNLTKLKNIDEPVFLHVRTIKGKGLGDGIEGTFDAHALSPPAVKSSTAQPAKSWTKIYSEGLTQLMETDQKVVALTAAMPTNTGLGELYKKYPNRVFDFGIAEANVYCSAGGMAANGLKPFVTVYSTFSQRAFDQMVHDIALQKLPVRIMMDRGGFVGSDGPTHHGVFDFGYLRMIPGMVHMAPRNELEMRRMLLTALNYEAGPIAMRYPRGNTLPMDFEQQSILPIEIGTAECLIDNPNNDVLIIAIGSMVKAAEKALELLAKYGIEASLIDARFIKPLDEQLLIKHIKSVKLVGTIEENVISTGFGESVLSLISKHDISVRTKVMGIPDEFISYGAQSEQLSYSSLLPEQIADDIIKLLPIKAHQARISG